MDDSVERFRHSYWTVIHNLDARRLRTWEEHGLTLPQLRVLFLLRAHPGLTTNSLATRLGITAATVSGLVDKLARAGLVARGQNLDDRRVIPLTLTDDGREIVGEIRQGNRAYLADLADELGPDLEPVTAALERLVAAIERRPASPEMARSEAPSGIAESEMEMERKERHA